MNTRAEIEGWFVDQVGYVTTAAPEQRDFLKSCLFSEVQRRLARLGPAARDRTTLENAIEDAKRDALDFQRGARD